MPILLIITSSQSLKTFLTLTFESLSSRKIVELCFSFLFFSHVLRFECAPCDVFRCMYILRVLWV